MLERKKQEKERARILAVANEVGISYGMMVFYLEQGLTEEEIRERYTVVSVPQPHRWARGQKNE